MKELNLEGRKHQLKINGEIYDLLLSEREIIEKANALLDKARKLDENNQAETYAVLNEPYVLLDAILGENAARRISGGRPVGFRQAMAWVTTIVRVAGEVYTEEIANE